jgi:hypothetical protein
MCGGRPSRDAPHCDALQPLHSRKKKLDPAGGSGGPGGSWGRQCSSATTRSERGGSSGETAEAAGQLPRRSDPAGLSQGAAAPDQPGEDTATAVRPGPGASGPSSARPVDSDDSRGTWSNGDTPSLGAGSARRRQPAVGRSGSGRGTTEAARQRSRPGGSSSGSARRRGSDDSRGARSNGDTPRPGAGSARRQRNGEGGGQRPRRSDPAGPTPGQQLRLSPAKRQRRQSGYVVERRHSPSWGRQCSSTATRSGAWQRQRNGESGRKRPRRSDPAGPARGGGCCSAREETATTVGVRCRRETLPSWGRQCWSTATRSGAERKRQRNGESGRKRPRRRGPAGPARGQRLSGWLSPAMRQRRQSGCAVEGRHSPS